MSDNNQIDKKIEAVLDEADRMFIATSVDNNSSGASVFFARDGEDLVFFTFHPTRKAEQIRVNPNIQAVVWPKGQEGIRGLQIYGRAEKINEKAEQEKARELVLETTTAFQEFMDDEFLKKNGVVGYYRVKPTTIKYIDFYREEKFEFREFPENQPSPLGEMLRSAKSRILLWMRAVRAPFFTAAVVPVALGAVIAYNDLATAGAADSFSWTMFWLAMIGGILAQAGTNMGNDYFDHTSRNDEYNKLASPFNGGSRMIQAGLMAPWKVLFATLFSFAATIAIGLEINRMLTGAYFGSSVLLWVGFFGVALGVFYTWNPVRLSYHGWGELAIGLGFGPVMVVGTHYVLTYNFIETTAATWGWEVPLLASLPVGILIMLVVWINQFQDVPADKKAGKNTWVVRLAGYEDGKIQYEKPFRFYQLFLYTSFALIFLFGVYGFIDSDYFTPFILISLLPLALVYMAVKWGNEWMKRWNMDGVDRQKLPYELLKVNVSTIGIHFLTGVLMVLGFWLNLVL